MFVLLKSQTHWSCSCVSQCCLPPRCYVIHAPIVSNSLSFHLFLLLAAVFFVHGILVRSRRQSMLFSILSSRVVFMYLHHYAPRLLLLRLLLLWSRSTSGHLGCCNPKPSINFSTVKSQLSFNASDI